MVRISIHLFFCLCFVGIGIIFVRFTMDDNLKIINQFKTISDNLIEDVTIVTSFINIGNYTKGHHIRNSTHYVPLMFNFSNIQNPVYAYFDDDEFLEFFKDIRSQQIENTLIRKIKRNQTWAFGLLPAITSIYSKPKYPKYHPNTYIPEYPCTMHAKYELMQLSAKENFFRTKYFAWADIGYFRRTNASRVHLWLPPNFQTSHIAYNCLYTRDAQKTPKDIVYGNKVWVGGGFFLGEVRRMIDWTQRYMSAVEKLINLYGLMSTDQQVLYAMANAIDQNISIQEFKHDKRFPNWYSLGNICVDEGSKHFNVT